MLKIKSLRVKNFRNMKEAEINFLNEQFTVLIGDNGSGKTAILESLTKGFVPIIKSINADVVKQCDLNDKDITYGKSATMVSITMELDGEEFTWSNRKRISPQVQFEDVFETNSLGDLKKIKAKYADCIEKQMLPLVVYYGTDRIIRNVPQRGHIRKFEVTDAWINCFDNINYFRDFYDWFKTEEDIELRGLRENRNFHNPRLDCVRNAIEQMVKGYKNLRIELAPARMLMTNADGVDLQIEQLSGGYKAVLSIVADIAKRLAMATPNSENPLNESAVILIDELDLHLHPKWQKTIVDDLKRTFPNCQFIITTHSPFIIQSIGMNELFDIDSMKYSKDARDCMENFNGWSIDAIQETQMNVTPKTEKYNELINAFSRAIDNEEYDKAKIMYRDLIHMTNPNSIERRIIKSDMETRI